MLYLWALFLIFSLFFILFPQIDITISSFFYDGKEFPAKGTLFEDIFYSSIRPLIIFFSLSSFAIYLYNRYGKKNIFKLNAKVLLYLFLVLSVAPGLIVNVLLKDNWGRSRPNEIVQFGGAKEFTPAFVPSSQKGNSFSSGHSAAAFSLIGFALLAKRKRKIWVSLAFTYGVLVSIARVIAGGHFLSDVVTSFFIVTISTLFLYDRLIKEKK
jgi:lipid A 4'-phosphatase